MLFRSGLSVLREIQKAMPQYSTVYLGDNARSPYGSRNAETIFKFTLEGVNELFRRDAELIILACNTSSSVALRRIQQDFLPTAYPSRRVLGIVIPTAEEVSTASRTKHIGILATEATVASRAYVDEIRKVDPQIQVSQQACPLLVPMIEAGKTGELQTICQNYVRRLLEQDARMDTILLGCTHYALVEEQIRQTVPPAVRVLSQEIGRAHV